jgi:HNH endonuclease
MRVYHEAWLEAHPERSPAWLKAMIAEGFQVHHIDGDHHNNHPGNLALIEGADHLRLHGLFRLFVPHPRAASRKGGNARWKGRTKEEKSNHMRMMAMAGVKKRRKEQKRRARQRKRAHEARKIGESK